MTDRQIVTSSKMAEAGFTTLKYRGADVVLDGGIGGACPADTTFYLNTDYLFYRPMDGQDVYTLKGDRTPNNQDAAVNMHGLEGQHDHVGRAVPGPPGVVIAAASPGGGGLGLNEGGLSGAALFIWRLPWTKPL